MARDVTGMAAGAAVLVAALGTSIANVALPDVAAGFGVPMAAAQWVVVGYLVAVTALVAAAGQLGDRYGFRRMLLAGAAAFTVGAVAGAVAPSAAALVAARVGQGAGAALMMALPVALLRAAVPAERLGRAMGLAGTLSAVGTALGPSLGGVLVGWGGWRAVFVAMALAGVVVLVAVWMLPRQVVRGSGRVGGAGTAALAGAVAAYALALTAGDMLLSAAAAAVALLFLLVGRVAASPLLPAGALADRGLRAGLAGNALVATVMMATLVVGPFWLTGAAGLTAMQAGLVLSAGPVISAASGVPAGRLVDRLGAAAVVRAGLWAMLAGAAGLALLPAELGIAGWLVSVLVLTPGYQLFMAANTATTMQGAPADRRGAVAGQLALARNLGLVTGAALMGTVYAAAGLAAAFGLAAGLVTLALAVARRAG